MLDGSRPSSVISTCSSHEGLEHLVLTHHGSTSNIPVTAILQTQDDTSSDSDCSSNSDDQEQPIYDLQLVVRALKTTLKHQDQQHSDQHRRLPKNSNDQKSSTMTGNDESSDEDEERSCLDTPTSFASLDDGNDCHLHTPTTSTSSSAIKPATRGIDADNLNFPDSNHQSLATGCKTLASHIQLPTVDTNSVSPNLLNAEDQENQDTAAKLAMHYFFENRFMKAKHLFERHAGSDPLHSLGLGSMLFLKAIMVMHTNDNSLRKESLDALLRTYDMATAQLEATVKEQSAFFGHSLFQYAQHCYYYLKCGNHHLSSNTSTRRHTRQTRHTTDQSQHGQSSPFVTNGVLRSHVIKAECCLQMAILYLLEDSYSGYVKCGLNIRRAYADYYFVWQEYQKMGQFHAGHIDKDTLSGLQFGIGAVHLILDSLPTDIKRIVSSFGWQPEKQLGMVLLQLSKEGDRIRSPWASLLLLAYYTIITSYCPQMLMVEYTQPAIEILLEAQQAYPHSAFFLHFAGRTSRIGRNLTLSTQSFLYAIEISKNDWAELDIFHICSHEIGFNAMMQMNWEEAIKVFSLLYDQGYWSRGIFRYLHGASLAMLGLDTEAILQFAQVPDLILNCNDSSTIPTGAAKSNTNKKLLQGLTDTERYVLQKVHFFESMGYQDCKLSLCALEYICLMDGLCYMDADTLDAYLIMIEDTLQCIVEMEQLEYAIREKEMDPETPLHKYVEQRAVLLWIRSCIFNIIGRYEDAIPHLNWIIDNKNDIEMDQWVIPFTLWEAGVTAWNMDNRTRGRELWEKAARYKNYSFESRMSWKIHLALAKAEKQGVPSSRRINSYQGRSDYKPITLSYY